uniref:Uncharacterized protein n=1 Tax=Glossina palpalis gambiensis TaxID=67801 RepID=A0A1B0B5W0_9MUSC
MLSAKVDHHRAESPKERIDHRVDFFFLRNDDNVHIEEFIFGNFKIMLRRMEQHGSNDLENKLIWKQLPVEMSTKMNHPVAVETIKQSFEILKAFCEVIMSQ